jgi:hypothetical protein
LAKVTKTTTPCYFWWREWNIFRSHRGYRARISKHFFSKCKVTWKCFNKAKMCGKETGFSPSVLYLKRTKKNEPESAFTGENSCALCRLTITLQSKAAFAARQWQRESILDIRSDNAPIKALVLTWFFRYITLNTTVATRHLFVSTP